MTADEILTDAAIRRMDFGLLPVNVNDAWRARDYVQDERNAARRVVWAGRFPIHGERIMAHSKIKKSTRLLVMRSKAFARIASKYVERKCEFCSSKFVAGPGADRRADARFCSDICRIDHNNLKRSRRQW